MNVLLCDVLFTRCFIDFFLQLKHWLSDCATWYILTFLSTFLLIVSPVSWVPCVSRPLVSICGYFPVLVKCDYDFVQLCVLIYLCILGPVCWIPWSGLTLYSWCACVSALPCLALPCLLKTVKNLSSILVSMFLVPPVVCTDIDSWLFSAITNSKKEEEMTDSHAAWICTVICHVTWKSVKPYSWSVFCFKINLIWKVGKGRHINRK